MAFADALQDTCTIYNTTVTTSATKAQVKSQSVRYSAIRCRLHSTSNQNRNEKSQGSFENFKNIWILQVEAIYNGAVRGDRVVVNSQNYIITKKHEIKGVSSSANHVVYTLEEQN